MVCIILRALGYVFRLAQLILVSFVGCILPLSSGDMYCHVEGLNEHLMQIIGRVHS